MCNKIILVLFLGVIFTGRVFAQNLKVNDQPVREGDNLNLFLENLEGGKIIFSLEEQNLKGAEITFDKGRTWLQMEKQADVFVYGYRPLSSEVIKPEMLLTDMDQGVKTYRPALRINYQKEKPDQQLEQFLEKFKSFYEDENKERFLSLFSMRYPDRVKFEQAIQNDFYNYKNMRLFYRIDNRAFDDDLEGAIWNVYWQRKYQDRNGNDLTESTANISMRFDKESGSWLITGLRNNTIFGSSLLANPDLSVTASDITLSQIAPGTYSSRIAANIHNIGSASASNVVIKYYKQCTTCPIPDAGFVDISSDQTITSIAAGATVSPSIVTYADPQVGPYTFNFKVAIDPSNIIGEDSETNNSASKSIVLIP